MHRLDDSHPARSEARRQDDHRLALKALLAVVLPVALAVLGGFSPYLWSSYGWVSGVPWILLLLVHVAVWWNATPNERSVLSLTLENADLIAERDELASQLDGAGKWVFHSYAATALRAMTTQYVQVGISNIAELQEAIGEMLVPLYQGGGEVFGFEPGERWSFSVFLFSTRADTLRSVWRERSANQPSGGKSREWGRGQGHVGKAFVDKKPIITGDAGHHDVIQLCGAPGGLERDYDQELYRSFASIPILRSEDDAMPFGVLVGTSDKKDRFDQDTAILLMHYAETIAQTMALAHAEYDTLRLKESNSADRETGDEKE